MAVLWQQPSSLLRCQALALLHFICLLFPPSGALSWDNNASPSPLEGFKLVKGNFSRTFLRVGYHKITEIPLGARNVNIHETVKSRNYLALQTQTGVSIVNGNWVIDRPGVFEGVGTQLTYRRPNEIRSRKGESITAPGPLTEDLHVYLIYQQPGPSVYYEYNVPLENTQPTPGPDASSNILGKCTCPHAKHTHTFWCPVSKSSLI
uniref:ADAMTS/ADAMTS-like Spacer 1 domain-containing protein n=1 Tax=Cynoglossus semilaevis TaxID=244447 RepID=A0A3P8V401_CYNSE